MLEDTGFGMLPAAGELEPSGIDADVLLEGQSDAGFITLTAADMGR